MGLGGRDVNDMRMELLLDLVSVREGEKASLKSVFKGCSLKIDGNHLLLSQPSLDCIDFPIESFDAEIHGNQISFSTNEFNAVILIHEKEAFLRIKNNPELQLAYHIVDKS